MSGMRAIPVAEPGTDEYGRRIATLCDAHGIARGSAADLGEFPKALEGDEEFAMEFWSLVARWRDEGGDTPLSVLNGAILERITKAVTGQGVAEMVAAGSEPRRSIGELGDLLAGETSTPFRHLQVGPSAVPLPVSVPVPPPGPLVMPSASPPVPAASQNGANLGGSAGVDSGNSDVENLRAEVERLKASFDAWFGSEGAGRAEGEVTPQAEATRPQRVCSDAEPNGQSEYGEGAVAAVTPPLVPMAGRASSGLSEVQAGVPAEFSSAIPASVLGAVEPPADPEPMRKASPAAAPAPIRVPAKQRAPGRSAAVPHTVYAEAQALARGQRADRTHGLRKLDQPQAELTGSAVVEFPGQPVGEASPELVAWGAGDFDMGPALGRPFPVRQARPSQTQLDTEWAIDPGFAGRRRSLRLWSAGLLLFLLIVSAAVFFGPWRRVTEVPHASVESGESGERDSDALSDNTPVAYGERSASAQNGRNGQLAALSAPPTAKGTDPARQTTSAGPQQTPGAGEAPQQVAVEALTAAPVPLFPAADLSGLAQPATSGPRTVATGSGLPPAPVVRAVRLPTTEPATDGTPSAKVREVRLPTAEPATSGAPLPKVESVPKVASAANVASAAKLEPAANVAPAAMTKRISTGAVAGAKISGAEPVYPLFARSAQISGSVVLDAVISKTGTVQNLKVVSGPTALQQSAVEAVKTWKYKPSLLDGQPVEANTTVVVKFNLNGR